MTPASYPVQPSVRPGRRASSEDDAAVTRLALSARDGDPARVDRFVRALHRDVWRYVAYLSADPEAADDLTQDVFLGRSAASTVSRAVRPPAPGCCPSLAAPWWTACVTRLPGRGSPTGPTGRPLGQAEPRHSPGFEDGIALAELLATIPAERREAFILTQLLGLPYAEAALALNCPVATVRSRVARARASLIKLLGEPDFPLTAPEGRAGRRSDTGGRFTNGPELMAVTG